MIRVTKLSVIIPAYNEETTITTILDAVSRVQLSDNTSKELIVINDASTDATRERILEWQSNNPETELVFREHLHNQGKGAELLSNLVYSGVHWVAPSWLVSSFAV